MLGCASGNRTRDLGIMSPPLYHAELQRVKNRPVLTQVIALRRWVSGSHRLPVRPESGNSFALRSGAGLVTRTTVTGCVTTRSTTHSLAEQKTGGCCAWPGIPNHQPPDFYAVFRGTYPSSRVVSSCAIANECATLPHYFAVCKAYLHLLFNIVRPSLISDISPSRLTANRRAILIGSCLKT